MCVHMNAFHFSSNVIRILRSACTERVIKYLYDSKCFCLQLSVCTVNQMFKKGSSALVPHVVPQGNSNLVCGPVNENREQ